MQPLFNAPEALVFRLWSINQRHRSSEKFSRNIYYSKSIGPYLMVKKKLLTSAHTFGEYLLDRKMGKRFIARQLEQSAFKSRWKTTFLTSSTTFCSFHSYIIEAGVQYKQHPRAMIIVDPSLLHDVSQRLINLEDCVDCEFFANAQKKRTLASYCKVISSLLEV